MVGAEMENVIVLHEMRYLELQQQACILKAFRLCNLPNTLMYKATMLFRSLRPYIHPLRTTDPILSLQCRLSLLCSQLCVQGTCSISWVQKLILSVSIIR